MKFTLPKNAFPSVKLSKSLQDTLIDEADTVVKEIVAAREGFLADGGQLDPKRWKPVRSKEGIEVHRHAKKFLKQRGVESQLPTIQSPSWSVDLTRARYHTSSSNSELGAERSTHSSMSSGIADDSIMERMRPPGVALMALGGTVDGTHDDYVFGSIAPTDDAWKLRSSHINDRLDDVRLLATLRGPTREDPYRFLSVKWFAKELPAVLTGIVHQRDFLIVESTGFTQDSKGDRIGYFLMHSISLPEIPELSELGMIRGLMSFCYLSSQGGPGKVNVFCRGFFDPRGDMPKRLGISIAADAAICCALAVEYAYIKKLRWLLNHSRAQNRSQTEGENRPTRCKACDKSFCKFLPTASGSGVTCQICHEIVCIKCSVTKKITVDVSDKGAVQQFPFCFCLGCLMKAKQLSSWNMALESVEAWSEVSASSASSPGKPLTPPIESYRREHRANSNYLGTRG